MKKAKNPKNTNYQIDMSGKIEQTNKDTVLAYSNAEQYSVAIPKKVKRQVQEFFRRQGLTRLYVYTLFSLGIFYLLKNIKGRHDIIIDLEYPGRDKLIKSLIKAFMESRNRDISYIKFSRIGNRPKAHYAAKNVFDKKVKPNYTIKLEDVNNALKKAGGRLRECFSTLVDAQSQPMTKSIPKKRNKVK